MTEDQNQNTPLIRVLDVFGNVFVLNVLFVIFCLPVVTIGASTSAMYTMGLKMVRKEEGHMVRGFWEAFKSNFKQSTIAWLIEVFVIVTLWGMYTMVGNIDGAISSFYSVVFVIEFVVAVLTFPFVYPLIAAFENTLWNTFKNAFLLSVSNLWSWAKIFVAWFAPVFISLNYAFIILNTWYMWLLLFFGLIGYGTSHTVNKVFKKIATTQEENIEFAAQKEERERKEKAAALAKAEKEAIARKEALAKIGSKTFEEDDLEKEEPIVETVEETTEE